MLLNIARNHSTRVDRTPDALYSGRKDERHEAPAGYGKATYELAAKLTSLHIGLYDNMEGVMNKCLEVILNTILSKHNKKSIHTNRDLSLRKDLGFDSLDLAELTAKLENIYGIDIFENGIIDRVSEIENIINARS